MTIVILPVFAHFERIERCIKYLRPGTSTIRDDSSAEENSGLLAKVEHGHLGTPLLQPVAYRPRRHGKGVGMPPGPPPNTNTNSPAPAPAPAAPSSLLSQNPSPVRPHISPRPHHRSAPAPLPNPFAPGLATGLPFWPAAPAAPGPAPPRPTPTSTHARSPPPPPPPAPALPHQDIPGLIADVVRSGEARMRRELYEVRDGLIPRSSHPHPQ
ncbi:hypothetical protein CF326_g6633 [Tilletia indica]|nr:hypothetical protein CF326_g6633 [Tilletia indica]